eukprot:TRINITY_DN1798_c0_g3_i3.p1 TRINITY_DN1798_c0_g3~~TRINITY_DN1798_c0_g3_i3.p1  ORF type:complete len:410 (+),score=27.84 TRINITY_DN1798_c0_g3_i3:39-1232(+)
MIREIVSLHIGQAGCQIGSACWELFCAEHSIDEEGLITEEDHNSSEAIGTFFQETASGKQVPRALYMDLEPGVLDVIRHGDHRGLYHPEQLISGSEDAANNFARGYHTSGKEIIEIAMDRIRRMCDHCMALQGFAIFLSVGGGTGSGLGSLLLNQLDQEFGKKPKLCFTVYPSPRIATSVVEPYNAVLSTHALLEHAEVVNVIDNEAVYEMCHAGLDVARPTYRNLNRLICQVISAMTASIRFEGALNVDINEFQTNLVPYPRIHFMISSFAPIISAERALRERQSVNEITQKCFEPANHLIKCDPNGGKYMAPNHQSAGGRTHDAERFPCGISMAFQSLSREPLEHNQPSPARVDDENDAKHDFNELKHGVPGEQQPQCHSQRTTSIWVGVTSTRL